MLLLQFRVVSDLHPVTFKEASLPETPYERSSSGSKVHPEISIEVKGLLFGVKYFKEVQLAALSCEILLLLQLKVSSLLQSDTFNEVSALLLQYSVLRATSPETFNDVSMFDWQSNVFKALDPDTSRDVIFVEVHLRLSSDRRPDAFKDVILLLMILISVKEVHFDKSSDLTP